MILGVCIASMQQINECTHNVMWSSLSQSFHALRDECYVRHSLQRQSALLHHATVGYAVDGSSASAAHHKHKPLQPLVSFTCTDLLHAGLLVYVHVRESDKVYT